MRRARVFDMTPLKQHIIDPGQKLGFDMLMNRTESQCDQREIFKDPYTLPSNSLAYTTGRLVNKVYGNQSTQLY